MMMLIAILLRQVKQLKMSKGIEVELIRSHESRIIIRYDNEVYNLVGDNYIYFNWWFEK
jgi:hypothetical protein